MLLPINRPTCANDLQSATNLAGEILRYAADYTGDTFAESHFCETVSLGEWLMQKRTTVGQAIEELFSLNKDERKALNNAFLHDVDFHNHVDEDSFAFRFPLLAPNIRDAGSKLLIAFYKHILAGSGFVGLPDQVNLLDKAAVEEGYRAANGKRSRICPACLGKLTTPVDGTSYVDREHFFPKSMYSPLSVHPSNVVLACIECNQRAHGDKDPIEPHRVHALNDTFLPYIRPGIDSIKLQFRPANPYAAVTITGNDSATTIQTRVENFDRIYKISERWSASLHCIHDTIMQSIHTELSDNASQDVILSKLSAVVRAKTMLRFTVQDAYLEGQYAEWLCENRVEQVMAEISNMQPEE